MPIMNYVLNTLKNKSIVIGLAAFIGLLFSNVTFAQDAKANNNAINFAKTDIPNPNAGVLSFETEEIDYGTIQQNEDGAKIFKFTNTGKDPIVITQVKTSCGCTVPTYSREPVLAGASGEIQIKYDTKRIGKFTKTITIMSNASEPNKVIRIKGEILNAEN